MTTEDQLATYLAGRSVEETRAVEAALNRLTACEQRLVGEAAVMGYVWGVMHGPYRDAIPKSSVLIEEVIGACLHNSDIYSAISTGVVDGVCMRCGSGVLEDGEHVRTDLPPCHPSLTVRDLFVDFLMAADHYGTPEAGAQAYDEFVTELGKLGFKLAPVKPAEPDNRKSDAELGYQQ